MQRQIFITTQFEGFHCYPNAPYEVSYLRNIHRHMFHVRVTIEVYHDDRDLEFIMVKQKVNEYIATRASFIPEHSSCEMIGCYLYNRLKSFYGEKRNIKIEVNEDGENGAIVGDII